MFFPGNSSLLVLPSQNPNAFYSCDFCKLFFMGKLRQHSANKYKKVLENRLDPKKMIIGFVLVNFILLCVLNVGTIAFKYELNVNNISYKDF